jgi:DNA-binding MarR family transcriptional regulator
MGARRKREDDTKSMDSFRRIVRALRSSHRAASDLDLTGAQLFILTTLGASREPMSVKDLAVATRTDQSTASVVVGRLVDRGLVKRVRSTVDTRRMELSLTARGKALQRKTPTTVAQTRLAEALGRLSAADAAALSRILNVVVDMMGEADAPAPMLFDDVPSGESLGSPVPHGGSRRGGQALPSKSARTRRERR